MKEIYFEKKEEAVTLCSFLFRKNDEISIRWKSHSKQGHYLVITSPQSWHGEWKRLLVEGLIHVFLLHREQAWLDEILLNCYYYTDDEERSHILELCQTLLCEETDLPRHELSRGKRSKILRELFSELLYQEEGFHFDSLVRFRLPSYREKLVDFVGYALDEYKREEDYQTYVENLREFVRGKGVSNQHLHIIESETLKIYNSEGGYLDSSQLRQVAYEEPLYLFGMGRDELFLSPIIAMAPHTISIYSDHLTNGTLITLLNVFQERVQIHPRKRFPFKQIAK
ncbi:hypothetical protein N781_10110 [Pontibacillus halophilus JSM 076056 = DSM 19796]|uniref:Sporulation protein YtxC n=1 Tax=Pontibacillus halophilus JSM 076056 = DSM 19796 TaxID=1385510 RepID=A0A0A5ICP7_9BACI|nr:sporulation protein YtxC [Pontibacillus halophilus]KGX93612.1 hypothetical protein N781_10110 [Pontibacillus halophilus JSM 076056 = DSM 19796]